MEHLSSTTAFLVTSSACLLRVVSLQALTTHVVSVRWPATNARRHASHSSALFVGLRPELLYMAGRLSIRGCLAGVAGYAVVVITKLEKVEFVLDIVIVAKLHFMFL